MNIEKLTEIAEWLEAGAPERNGVAKFDMSEFFYTNPECGTCCCIGGAAIQFNDDRHYTSREEFYKAHGWAKGTHCDYAAELLGLDADQQEDLFFPYDYTEEHPELNSDIPPAWAARCIRKLVETGKVDWLGTYVPLPLQP